MHHRSFRLNVSLFSVALATATLLGGGTLAGIATGTLSAAMAQSQPDAASPAPGSHGARMGQILMSLNLTDDQKTKVRSIWADARKQNQGVTDRDARRANMKAARDKMEAIMTPAQRSEFETKMAAVRAQDAAPRPQ